MAGRGVQIEGYEHFELIGEGGFSQVFRARQVAFDRDVAVKVLDVGLDERQRRAFERECRAMGVVSQHPHIVTVYSATYTSDGRPCIVMELYGGGTSADRVRREGAVPATDVLELGVRICGALQTAHERGLLHRDVKPQNLFLSDYGAPALGDFGISSFDDDRAGGTGGLSVHYAAPEVIEHQRTSVQSDVYSLGATLYTLLAGRRPYATPGTRQRVADVALKVLREDPPRITGGAPAPLVDMILAAMARHPDDRPSSAAAFGRRLQQVQDELGHSRTPLAIPTSPSPSPPTDDLAPVLDESNEDADTMTVARASGGPPPRTGHPRSGPGAEDAPTRDRGIASVAAGVIAVVGLAAVAWLATTGDDQPAPAPTSPTEQVAATDPVLPPPVPSEVEVSRGEADTIEVQWESRDEPGLTWQVRRVDDDHAEDPPIPADETHAVLTDVDPAERPCVQVRTLNAVGQASRPSGIVCLG